jgi:signal transduction histidine kinase
MEIFNRLPINKKLTLIIFLSNIIVLLLVFLVTSAWNINSIRNATIESAQSSTRIFSQDFTKVIVFDSPHTAADTVSRLKAMPYIKNAVLYNSQGHVVFAYDASIEYHAPPPKHQLPTNYFENGYLHLYSDVIYEQKHYGTVYYRLSTDLLNETIVNYAAATGLFIVFLVLTSLFIAYKFQNIFSSPIINLTKILNKVAKNNDYSLRAQTTEQNEIGQLYTDYNFMIEEISSKHDELARKNAELENHRTKLESIVMERTKELNDYAKELEAFSYSVSHDLRAPLRSINGFSAMLLEEYGPSLNDEGKDMLSRILNSSNRMGELIDDLLQLSRINQHEIAKQPINLSDIAFEIFGEKLPDKINGHTPQLKVQANIKIKADPTLIRVVMDNLISNALKYSQRRETAEIEVGSQQDISSVTVFIKDNGVGFDMNYVKKLFTPFERLHSPGEYEGTGIGLATVKRIIERHGGEVWAQSELNRGATFYFRLPYQVASA